MKDINTYSNRLSMKENIAYEQAQIIMNKSINRLKSKQYKCNNIIKSAYKYSRIKLNQK